MTKTENSRKGNESICTHQPDADEPRDQVELAGFSPVNDMVAVQATECLGFACPMPSAACDACKFGDGASNDVESSAPRVVHFEKAYPSYIEMRNQTGRKDSLEDLYSVASNARGARASIEAERMKNFCP